MISRKRVGNLYIFKCPEGGLGTAARLYGAIALLYGLGINNETCLYLASCIMSRAKKRTGIRQRICLSDPSSR